MRAPRDEDDLCESDLIYFTRQFQAPRSRESHRISTTEDGPVRCRGIDCYRCGAHISECQGLCAKCGTMCQRPGGPCSACRDICENCNKPRPTKTSVTEFWYKGVYLFLEEPINNKVILFLNHELFR